MKLIKYLPEWKDLTEVTSHKIFEMKKFPKNGLFSQTIFGPIKSYQGECNNKICPFKGAKHNNEVCPVCNVEMTTSESRKKKYAKIVLPFEVFNPLIYNIATNGKTATKKLFEDMLYYRYKYFVNEDGKLIKIQEDTEVPDDAKIYSGLEGVEFILNKLIEDFPLKEEMVFLDKNRHIWFITNILVNPPDFRPCSIKPDTKDNYIIDDVNGIFQTIIRKSNQIKALSIPLNKNDEIYIANFKHIQKDVLNLFDYVMDRMSKKKGLLRSNILGKRVDFSGRAVITPDPTLNVHECRLPYWMVLEIYKPQIVTHLVNRRVCKRYNQAIKLIESELNQRSTKYYEMIKEFCVGKTCVLNRQPTLHRLSMLAFEIKLHLGNTINIHPLICAPYNADFDGDAMAVYIPVTQQSIADINDKIAIWNNLLSPTDLEIVPEANQDIILGLYTATQNDTSDDMVEYKGHQLTVGRAAFNKCLPEGYPVINMKITKSKLKSILNDIALRYSEVICMQTLDCIKNLGFKLTTQHGYTLCIRDLYSKELEDIANNLTGDPRSDLEIIQNSEEVNKHLKSMSFAPFIESGARGSWDQVKTLVFSTGYKADITNKVRPNLIRSSLVTGLSSKEFFDSCYGSRKGLLDTALSTGDSGYLTRQLIYSTVHQEIDPDTMDCGSTDTLSVYVNDYKTAKCLLWRKFLDDNGEIRTVTHKNFESHIGKHLRLRSPIYCKSKKICKTCYGGLNQLLHSNQAGIVATQAIGERTTQLVLRTFHISGVAQGTNVDNDDIISGMAIVKKLFHKPSSFKEITSPADLVMMIHRIFSAYGTIQLVHHEVIVASMMWYGNTPWRNVEDRDEKEYEYVSILQVPNRISWLMGGAFSNLRSRLISGLVSETEDTENALTKLFRF